MKKTIIILRRMLYVLFSLFGGLLFLVLFVASPFVYIITGDNGKCAELLEKYEHWCDYVVNPD